MRPILYLTHLYQRCIALFKRNAQTPILRRRREGRLGQLKISNRQELEIAKINCALTQECDHTTHTSLCVRCSLSYEHFYHRQSKDEKKKLSTKDHLVTLMAIDFQKFTSYAGYLSAIRKHSFFERKAKKAMRVGYLFEAFQGENYLPDIKEIRQSNKWRGLGLPADPYVLTPETLNTKPSYFAKIQTPKCNIHWEKWFGIFQSKAGHMQGQIKTHQRLIAYARIRRIGNTVKYAELIGHCEHLNNGVMAFLHLEIMKYFFDPVRHDSDKGIQYITYNNVERGADGLFFWKRKALFMPYEIEFCKHPLPFNFDPQQYLLLNPDINGANVDPATHYQQYGHLENRQH